MKEARKNAWANYIGPMRKKQTEFFLKMTDVTTCNCAKTAKIEQIKKEIAQVGEPIRKDIMSSGKKNP